MIVASHLNAQEITELAHNPKALCQHVERTIPLWMRSVKLLHDNQYYYAATLVRLSNHLPIAIANRAIQELVAGKSAFGVLGTFTPFYDVASQVNTELLHNLMLKEAKKHG